MSSIPPASRPSAHNQSDPSTASSSEFHSVTTHSPPPLTAPKSSTFSPAQTIALPPTSVQPTSSSAKSTSPSISPAVVTPSTLSPSPSPSVAQYPFPSKPSKKIPSPNPSSSSSAQVQPSSPRGPITTPPAGLQSPSLNPNINSTYPPDKIPGGLAPSSGPSNVKHPNKIPPQALPIGQFSPPPKFSAPASSNFRPSSPFAFPASNPSLEPVPKRTKSSDDVISPLGSVIIVAVGVLMIILAVVSFVIWYAMKRRKVQQGDNYLRPSLGSFCYETDRLSGTQSWTRSEFSPSSGQSSIRHSSAPQPFPVQGYENGCKSYNSSIARDMLGTVRSMNDTSRHGWGYLRSMFTYDQLAVATNGFSRENLLGVGGFGYVYKGYLQDGRVVAVKQLKVGGGQGEREFQAEVEIISRVHHRHLVSLVGYSIAGSQRLLVYDYVPNGNLEQHLHGSQRDVLDWATRIKIAVGAARGLAYLHEDCHPQIIHRDIKSSNILLDNNFEARVSDFGLAKLATDTDTHMTTRVMGTFGYLAPEYASSGKLTERSDVYSFGVLLLELVTGRRPVDTSQPVGSESLVEWVRPLLYRVLEYGNFEELADPDLKNFDRDKMFCILRVAAACICYSAQRRPRMGQVVRALEDNAGDFDLSNGVQPGHSVDYDCPEHFALVRTFRMMAFGHQEYGSNYSSEYGLHLSVPSSELQRSNEREGRTSRYTRTDSHSPLFGPCDEHKTNGALETHVVNRPQSFMDDNW